MGFEPSWGLLLSMAGLAAIPFVAVAIARRGQPENLPRTFGRWVFVYAALFSMLLFLLRARGIPAPFGVLGLVLGFMGTQRGIGPLYRFAYGPAALERYPHVVASDADRLHLVMLIAAVLSITAGLIFATLPALS